MEPWRRQLRDAVDQALTALRDRGDRAPDDVRRELQAILDARDDEQGSAPPPFLPVAPVLGVDACSSGWVGVALGPEGRPTVHTATGIEALVEQVRETREIRVVGIDIPIGLPDAGVRAADGQARRALPGKSSSVFTTLTRAAYQAPTYALAREAQREATGGRHGASAQGYGLRAKILDVDTWMRDRGRFTGVEVIEVHPELSFARMAGGPLLDSKKTPAGQAARRRALAGQGMAVPAWFRGSGFAEDDLLDACAVAWTAARRAAGQAEPLPDPPEILGDGLPAAIWR